MSHIYLDYNASTPVNEKVAEVMRTFLEKPFGTPSSKHWAGASAKDILENARQQVAELLGAKAEEIVFTSGGSEANNQALKGTFFALKGKGDHVISQVTEHPAILEPLRFLERLGAKVTYLPVDRYGLVDPDAVRRAITPRTVLITVMHANNETGTIQPIETIGAIAREHGIRFHSDAAQSIGKIPVRVDRLGVDLLSITGHKLYAPKGIGVLYVRTGTALEPLIHGAGHEYGMRAGTESAMLAAALGEASSLASDLGPVENIRSLRDYFWKELRSLYGDRITLNGHSSRLPNTLNVSFLGQVGAEVLERLEGVAASTGSHADRTEPSPVLLNMGLTEDAGMGAVRFSLGRETTRLEIELVMDQFRSKPFSK